MSTSKHKLIEDNMNLVYFVIYKYYPGFSKDEDLVQEGFCGLCKAADTFDESKGFTFSTYAIKVIIGHIKMYFRSQMKHDGVYSLDKTVIEHEGETMTFGDLIVDETANRDFDWVERDDFVDGLDSQDQSIVTLLKEGLTHGEISEETGISPMAVGRRVRAIKSKWRIQNGKN